MIFSTHETDFIEINNLFVECIIGVYPEELLTEQPLNLDIKMGLDLAIAGRSGKINDTCDYAQIAQEIKALLKFRKYRLLENAAEEICAMIFGIYKPITSIQIRIKKPKALAEIADYAAVNVTRFRKNFPSTWEDTSFGKAEILLETEDAGLYLLHIDVGNQIRLHYHLKMNELEWLIAGKVDLNGAIIEGFLPRTWGFEEQHYYKNIGNSVATVFCCDKPAFIPEDEILVK